MSTSLDMVGPETKDEFEAGLAAWLVAAQAAVDASFARFPGQGAVLSLDRSGRRYIRVVRTFTSGTGRDVYCFIDTRNGHVLKADSWKKPAMNFARGSIYTLTGLTGA